MVRHEAAIGTVIVRVFTAKIETAIRQGVVKESARHALVRPPGYVEGDVLVERIGRAGVITHGVEVRQTKASSRPVHGSGRFPQSKKLLARGSGQIMAHPTVPPAKIIGLSRSIAGQGPPGLALAHLPAAMQVDEPDGEPKAVRRNDQPPFGALVHTRRGTGKSAGVEPIPPLERNILGSRRYGPGARVIHLAFRQNH